MTKLKKIRKGNMTAYCTSKKTAKDMFSFGEQFQESLRKRTERRARRARGVKRITPPKLGAA
jgi:hypothetical protein